MLFRSINWGFTGNATRTGERTHELRVDHSTGEAMTALRQPNKILQTVHRERETEREAKCMVRSILMSVLEEVNEKECQMLKQLWCSTKG